MSTFSPISSWSSKGMWERERERVCVHLCVCVCGMNLKCAQRWHIHISVHSVVCQCTHTHTYLVAKTKRRIKKGAEVSWKTAPSPDGIKSLENFTYCTQTDNTNANSVTEIQQPESYPFCLIFVETMSNSPWTQKEDDLGKKLVE